MWYMHILEYNTSVGRDLQAQMPVISNLSVKTKKKSQKHGEKRWKKWRVYVSIGNTRESNIFDTLVHDIHFLLAQ